MCFRYEMEKDKTLRYEHTLSVLQPCGSAQEIAPPTRMSAFFVFRASCTAKVRIAGSSESNALPDYEKILRYVSAGDFYMTPAAYLRVYLHSEARRRYKRPAV